MSSKIGRNIYLLGLLSLFNDVSSDAVTPFLPAYLSLMGMGPAFLGLMEGSADFLSNICKLLSGRIADRLGHNKRLTVFGYSLSAFLRPFIAISVAGVVLGVRLLDRVGKGIRTAPRDNLITASVDSRYWGKAFGIQRAMDHTGALVGPLLASWLLMTFHWSLPQLFLVASLPAALSILILPVLIREEKGARPAARPPLSWKRLPPGMKRYVLIMFLAACSTPSELFLILKMQRLGLTSELVPIAWFVLTLFALIAAYLGGLLSDVWSRRGTIAIGWTLFIVVYLGFAVLKDLPGAWLLMAIYGVHMGIIEAAERSYPALLVSSEERASALGWYYFAYGMGLLPASLVFGFVWNHWGDSVAFLLNAGLTLLVLLMLPWLPSSKPGAGKPESGKGNLT